MIPLALRAQSSDCRYPKSQRSIHCYRRCWLRLPTIQEPCRAMYSGPDLHDDQQEPTWSSNATCRVHYTKHTDVQGTCNLSLSRIKRCSRRCLSRTGPHVMLNASLKCYSDAADHSLHDRYFDNHYQMSVDTPSNCPPQHTVRQQQEVQLQEKRGFECRSRKRLLNQAVANL